MRIGVFDSGLGGLSTLLACRRRLPEAEFFFFADTANAPYGDRSADEVRALTQAAYERFLELGVDALVIACNTATSAAVAPLRQQAAMPVIGIEPAIKQALAASSGEVLLLATELTVRGEKLERLRQAWDAEQRVRALACPGWMEIIEAQTPDWRLRAEVYWQRHIAPELGASEAIVLGCTHYCWLQDEVGRWSGGLPVFDGNEGVARQLYRLLRQEEPNASGTLPENWTLRLHASAAAAEKRVAAERLLRSSAVEVRVLPF